MVSSLIAKGAFSVARSASRSQVRAISSSVVVSKDHVTEIYLRELKAYKAPAKAADAHVGQVRDFHAPQPPKAPVVPSSAELSSQLETYAAAEPDLAPKKSDKGGELTEGEDVNAYLREAAADHKVEAAHH
ncbi:hypothetical protein IE53DRAFT_387527 [Violaceomyces palustris]|uniref:Uncharacterized protein n=1 Tax=Violaceomyces palustris TaxID=1673888 RepID=A0ACD0NWM7_9BASI|nr:hypothetical protein IE53DRAFT_387527 [Violaceomyces palustris]